MTKNRYRELRRLWRVASRDLLAAGAIELAWACTHALRNESGRFLTFDRHPGPVRKHWLRYGPYLCGRRGALSR